MPSSLKRTVVLNVVGLSASLVSRMPRLNAWASSRRVQSFAPAFPAVTCTVQSSYLTGEAPAGHGVVGNGWYNREMCEVQFWKQSNKIVKGSKIWDILRERHGKDFTCAQLFWWYNMYANVEWSITPRPMYPVDGRKVFDIYTQPMSLRETIKKDLGEFPFPWFWGPNAGIPSSQWIARSARWIEEKEQPVLSFVYLPHLDYCLQKIGPQDPAVDKELQAIDEVVGSLLEFYGQRGVNVIVLSEYGISSVNRPIYLNRLFRDKGWLTLKPELGREMLDCGASRVFAVADHQVAHVYINDPSLKEDVRTLLQQTPGVDEIREPSRDWDKGSVTERAGDFIAVAEDNSWFAYYYWEDDSKAPDFARCIDIHRKPGYDPAELFVDPSLKLPMLRIAAFLLKKKLGFRALMEIIPLDATLVKGSHGRDNVKESECPVFIGDPSLPEISHYQDVFQAILQAVDPRKDG